MKKIILIAAIAALVACGAEAISAKKTITKKSSSTTTATATAVDAISGATATTVETTEVVPECCEVTEEPVAEAVECCEDSSKKCCNSGSGECNRVVADSAVSLITPIGINEAVAVDTTVVSTAQIKAKSK